MGSEINSLGGSRGPEEVIVQQPALDKVETNDPNSVFLQIADNGDGVVNEHDINIKKNRDLNFMEKSVLKSIANYMERHYGEAWTEATQWYIDNLVSKFQEAGAESSPAEEYNKFREQTLSDYNSFRTDTLRGQKEYTNQVWGDYGRFVEDAHSRQLEFKASVAQDLKDTKREYITKFLEGLKEPGWSGQLNAGELGSISYDSKSGQFKLTQANGEEVFLSEDQVEAKITEIVDSGVAFNGNSKYKKVGMGV